MKPRFLLTAALLLAVCSCNHESPQADQTIKSITFSADPFIPIDAEASDTKVALNGNQVVWMKSDTLGVFPDAGAQVYFNSKDEGSTLVSFDGGGWEFKNSANYYSYYPFIEDIFLDRRHIPVSYAGQVQDGIDDTNVGESCFMYTGPTSAESGGLHFQYHALGTVIMVKVTLPAGTYTHLALTVPDDLLVIDGWYDLMSDTPVIIPTKKSNQLIVGLKNITLTETSQFNVYLMLAPVNLKGINVTVSVLNSEKVEYQQLKTPSAAYNAGARASLTCAALTPVPAGSGLIANTVDTGEIEDAPDSSNPGF